MTHIITRACCNDAACVPVCPVNCIHPTPDEPDYLTAEMLYIDPDGCVDCGACVDACPVSAIHADYDLPDEYARFEDINARYFSTPERTDYPKEAVIAPRRAYDAAPVGPLRVAVIGSGPAASYAAEELMSQRGLEVEVDIFERLPVPWGLVRFGVAPDHQDTKAASTPFARTLRRAGCRIFLNTEVGKDVSLDDIRSRYHAVVVAVGAMGDRSLGVPGEELPGSHSATEFVAWYNGHPDFATRSFDLSHERAVVVGNGNVALDVARVLASEPERLARTDIADHALEVLQDSKVREVVVVARRGPLEAAFTTKELLGIAEIPGVDLVVDPADLDVSAASIAAAGDPASSVPMLKLSLLRELSVPVATSERRVVLKFLASPTALDGSDRVRSVQLERNELVEADGRLAARGTGVSVEVEAGLVFRSVGYFGREFPGVPFDERRGVVPNDRGRVIAEDGSPVTGYYTTGWIKRGPSGVIGSNKRCAKETVAQLLDDFTAGTLPAPSVTDDVASLIPDHLDLDAWKRIDQHEVKAGKALKRPRVKLVDVPTMLDVARP